MTRDKRKQYNYNLIHKIINGVEYKQCTNKNHQEWLPMTEEYFYKWKYSTSDGFHSQCIKCIKDATNNRNNNNLEKHRKTSRDFRNKNRDRYNNVNKQWRQDNHDHKREYEKDYYINNPEKFKEYTKNHRIHDITEKEWRECLKIFDYCCIYCGLTEEESKKIYKEKLHKDHVDHNGYNDLRNAVPGCKSCNSQKHQSDMETWFRQQEFFTEGKLAFIKWWTIEGYKDYIEEKPPYRIIKEKNKENKKFHWNLWIIDKMRNPIEIIATKDKRKDLVEDIKKYFTIK